MADYNSKSFVYDARGFNDNRDIQDKIDSDVSDYLTAQGATHFDHMATSVNDKFTVVTILWNDAL